MFRFVVGHCIHRTCLLALPLALLISMGAWGGDNTMIYPAPLQTDSGPQIETVDVVLLGEGSVKTTPDQTPLVLPDAFDGKTRL